VIIGMLIAVSKYRSESSQLRGSICILNQRSVFLEEAEVFSGDGIIHRGSWKGYEDTQDRRRP